MRWPNREKYSRAYEITYNNKIATQTKPNSGIIYIKTSSFLQRHKQKNQELNTYVLTFLKNKTIYVPTYQKWKPHNGLIKNKNQEATEPTCAIRKILHVCHETLDDCAIVRLLAKPLFNILQKSLHQLLYLSVCKYQFLTFVTYLETKHIAV